MEKPEPANIGSRCSLHCWSNMLKNVESTRLTTWARGDTKHWHRCKQKRIWRSGCARSCSSAAQFSRAMAASSPDFLRYIQAEAATLMWVIEGGVAHRKTIKCSAWRCDARKVLQSVLRCAIARVVHWARNYFRPVEHIFLQDCNTLAHSAHARAWLAHGACKFYKCERSYNIYP